MLTEEIIMKINTVLDSNLTAYRIAKIESLKVASQEINAKKKATTQFE